MNTSANLTMKSICEEAIELSLISDDGLARYPIGSHHVLVMMQGEATDSLSVIQEWMR